LSKVTPMLAQYNRIKAEYPDCLLLFRLGDFYELFGADAEIAARELSITLTSREAGKGRRIPMCGVPHHAVDSYITQLVQNGHRVAVCEQLEDPRLAKGVVKRDVVRVITPGTAVEENMNPAQNRYLAAVAEQRGVWGLAVCDLSTGEFSCTQMSGRQAADMIDAELSRIKPSELLLPENYPQIVLKAHELNVYIPEPDSRLFERDFSRRQLLEHFKVISLDGFGVEHWALAVRCAGAILAYLSATQKTSLGHIVRLAPYHIESYMVLDAATRRNLELTQTLRNYDRHGSLLWVLDRTKTAMGARLLRQWLEQPLLEQEPVERRLDAVAGLCDDHIVRPELGRLLKEIYDIPRLISRVALSQANARDLLALARSLRRLPAIRDCVAQLPKTAYIEEILSKLDPCDDAADSIEAAIAENPPVGLNEGGLIKPGYNREVDELRAARSSGQAWVAELERQERERTGIKSLKVGFNKVFGYYIEVTKANLAAIPTEYERKQTLANAERFITPELKAQEAKILGADERVIELEYQLFTQLRAQVAEHAPRIQTVARALAELDVLRSLAEVAVENHYVRPTLNHAGRLNVKAGRHPVVEAVLIDERFTPNDILMDAKERQIMVLTGPNMAGKSTYLRQTALIVLMAHIGSFVPAESADIPLVDRIFTRVGASDDLATGQSTFMVEMNEVANILNNATARSLVILDEVGRGTSTFDGLSIAWAVTEYLHNKTGCQPLTLFATHYHELTELAGKLPRVHNCSVAVKEENGQVVFLRRIVPGGTDRSYGIEVARLAGLPYKVIQTARRILAQLESSEHIRMELNDVDSRETRGRTTTSSQAARLRLAQVPLFSISNEPEPLLEQLAQLDAESITPREAINLLFDLRDKAQERLKEMNNGEEVAG
jgi:DNA mismatch repair protein MutS